MSERDRAAALALRLKNSPGSMPRDGAPVNITKLPIAIGQLNSGAGRLAVHLVDGELGGEAHIRMGRCDYPCTEITVPVRFLPFFIKVLRRAELEALARGLLGEETRA